jgi:hypothetical protein
MAAIRMGVNQERCCIAILKDISTITTLRVIGTPLRAEPIFVGRSELSSGVEGDSLGNNVV